MMHIMIVRIKETFYDSGHKKEWILGRIRQRLVSLGFSVIAGQNAPFAFWPACLQHVVVARKGK
jgi:hypothetical protein